jgi:hypothetical protein
MSPASTSDESGRLDVTVHTSNPSTQEGEVGNGEFKASLGYTGRHYFKEKRSKRCVCVCVRDREREREREREEKVASHREYCALASSHLCLLPGTS